MADSWQKLSHSCRSIADAIIKLLEILYGAETQRIYIVNEKLQKATKAAIAIPQSVVSDDQQKFADSASDAATYANHLAQFLQMRAQDEDSPYHQQELNQAANELLEIANSIVNQANECMDEPEQAAPRNLFNQHNAKAAEVANKIVSRIKEIEDMKKFPPKPVEPPAPAPAPAPAPVQQPKPANPPAAQPPRQNPAPQQKPPQQQPAQQRPPQRQPAARAPPANRPNDRPKDIQEVVDAAKQFAAENEVILPPPFSPFFKFALISMFSYNEREKHSLVALVNWHLKLKN